MSGSDLYIPRNETPGLLFTKYNFMYLRAVLCTFQIFVDFYCVPVGGRGGGEEGREEGGEEGERRVERRRRGRGRGGAGTLIVNNALSPSFHIHVSVSNLYIPRIGLPILLRPNSQTHKSLTGT
jgi:hypothetical protein